MDGVARYREQLYAALSVQVVNPHFSDNWKPNGSEKKSFVQFYKRFSKNYAILTIHQSPTRVDRTELDCPGP